MTSKIIVSLTILPSRINTCKRCIESLLIQSKCPDVINVWIPENCKRDNTVIENYPSFLINEKIKIQKHEDLGPITKILPTLKQEWETDNIIITADDDVVYPKNWIKNLIAASKKQNNSVICYRGRNFKTKENLKYSSTELLTCRNVKVETKVDIVTGTWGALYKPKFFTDEIFSVDLTSKFFFVDDIWLSGQLKKNNIPIYVIPSDEIIAPDSNHSVTSLWEINRRTDNNDYGIMFFEKFFKK